MSETSDEQFDSPYLEALGDAYLRLAVGRLLVETFVDEVELDAEPIASHEDDELDEIASLQFKFLIEKIIHKATKMTADEYKEQAMTDILTGLPNKRSLKMIFKDVIWEGYKRNAHKDSSAVAGSVLFFDIDNFGDFNTNHGHQGGDEVLKTVAQVVDEHIRPTDLFGRLAGDEFVVVFPGLSEEEALVASNNVVKAVRDHASRDITDIPITISGGLAGITSSDFGPNVHMADQALYLAKDNGRNQVATYEDFLNSGRPESAEKRHK